MSKRTMLSTALAVAVLLTAAVAQAATYYFDNATGDGLYQTEGNWTDGTYRYLPAINDVALIASGNTATLTSGAVAGDVLQYLYVGYADADDLPVYGNGTLVLNNPAAEIHAAAMSVGYCSSATRGCTGAVTLNSGSLYLTSPSYIAQGDVATSDAGGINGSFTQTGGTVNIAGSGDVSVLTVANQANSHGAITITGDNSVLDSQSSLRLGYHSGATATMTIGTAGGTDKPTVSFGASIRIGSGADDGGAAAEGTLTVQGAGTFSAGSLILGGQSSSTGNAVASVYIKDNAKLSMTAANASSYIGNYYGDATVTQTGGEATFAYGVHLGFQTNSEGTYNISGGKLTLTVAGTTAPARSLGLGYAATGKGTFNLSGAGVVDITPRLYVGISGQGDYNQSGGSTTVGNYVILANGSSSTGTLDVSGGTFDAGTNPVYVGYAGTGTFKIRKPTATATTVTVGDVLVGGNTGTAAKGYLIQSGGDFSTANLTVGNSGTGEYTLSGGNATVAGATVIGNLVSATGTMTQSGGVYSAGGALTIGNLGAGTYNLSGGTADMNGNNVAGAGTFNFSGGTLKNAGAVSAAVTLQSGGTGAVLHQDAGIGTLVSAATGGDGGFTKTGSGTLTFNGTVGHSGRSILTAGTTVLYGSTAMNTALTNTRTDLQAGSLVVDYSDGTTGVADAVELILSASYGTENHFAEANGAPIYCSTATDLYGIGWMDDAANSQVLVKRAVYGDADLSGVVGATDLGLVLTNFGLDAVWSTGDFDYSGMVGASDLGLVLTNFGQALPTSLDISGYNLDAEAIRMLNGAGINLVPEPSTFVLLAAGLAGLLAYAGRKRR